MSGVVARGVLTCFFGRPGPLFSTSCTTVGEEDEDGIADEGEDEDSSANVGEEDSGGITDARGEEADDEEEDGVGVPVEACLGLSGFDKTAGLVGV